MKYGHKIALAVLGSTLGLFTNIRSSDAAAVTIGSDQSAVVDGFNITTPAGVTLTVNSSGNQLLVTEAATFTSVNDGLQVAFLPVGTSGTTATSIDITSKTVANDTGQSFSDLYFLLMNTQNTQATFSSVANVFAPPTGAGYNYTSVKLSGGDLLTYAGSQNAGVTATFGSLAAGDNLLINTPFGSAFSLKELPAGGAPTPVPLPAAACESAGLLGALWLVRVGRARRRAIIR